MEDPTDPLAPLREQLALTSREREYIDFDARALDADARRAARDLLVDAALAGDPRAPAVLGHVESGEALRATLEGLLRQAPVRARVEAGHELRSLLRTEVQLALGDAIRQGQLDRPALRRALELVLALGGAPWLMTLLDAVNDEALRTTIIDALWEHKGLSLYPTVWWSGLGLLRRTLNLPIASFRGEVLERFKRLLGSTPNVEGYAPGAGTLPTALKAAMDDVKRGQGAPSAELVAALSDDERRALLVFAADQALNMALPRAVLYVAYLGGARHRDVVEWAATNALDKLRAAGAEALRMLDAPA